MDVIWESEMLLNGWLLPAGAALIALGLTSIGAAGWMHFRSRSEAKAIPCGGHVDGFDQIETVDTVSKGPCPMATDATVLSQLDEQINRLEAELEKVELLSRSQPRRSVDVRTAELHFVGSQSEARSPETQALAALVARGH